MSHVFPSSPHPAVFLDTVRAVDATPVSTTALSSFITAIEAHTSIAPSSSSQFSDYWVAAAADEAAKLFRSLPRDEIAERIRPLISSAPVAGTASKDDASSAAAAPGAGVAIHSVFSALAEANAARAAGGFAVSVAPLSDASRFPTVAATVFSTSKPKQGGAKQTAAADAGSAPSYETRSYKTDMMMESPAARGAVSNPVPGDSMIMSRSYKTDMMMESPGTGFDTAPLAAYVDGLSATNSDANSAASVTVLSDGTKRVCGSVLCARAPATVGRAHTLLFPQPPALPAAAVAIPSTSAAANPDTSVETRAATVRVSPFAPSWALHSARNAGPRVPRIPAYAPLVFALDPVPHATVVARTNKGGKALAANTAAGVAGAWSLAGVLVQSPSAVEAAYEPVAAGAAETDQGPVRPALGAALTAVAPDTAVATATEVLLTPYSKAYFAPVGSKNATAPAINATEHLSPPAAVPPFALTGGRDSYSPLPAVTLPAPATASAGDTAALVSPLCAAAAWRPATVAPRVSVAHTTFLPHAFGLHALHPVYVFTPHASNNSTESPEQSSSAAAVGPSVLVDPVGFLVLVETPAAAWAHALDTAKDTVRCAWPRPAPTVTSSNSSADAWAQLEDRQARRLLIAVEALQQQVTNVLAPSLLSMARLGAAMGMSDDS